MDEGLETATDRVREYTDEEKRALTLNLDAITSVVYRGDLLTAPPSFQVLKLFHRRIFEGVRDHGGRHRCRDFGSEYLVVMSRRAPHKNEVEKLCEDVFRRLDGWMRQLRDPEFRGDYELESLRACVWTHAELVRIQPFEDGNKRASRLMFDHIMVCLGHLPIPMEAPRSEYYAALERFFARSEIGPLVDLYLRLAADQPTI